ncbi:MAG: monovalent cation/H(+) antiporter subunit G [Lentisphaeria bacterium]|nr:monovalent cation/H(+) antiporter subunit G [Lentisphaeria bacterium]
MESAINITVIVMIVLGILFFLGAVVGILRFPDFYTRCHAAGKGDTLSTLLILGAFAIYQLNDMHHGWYITSGKILIICFFILVTSPTATHALLKAGYLFGIEPWKKGDNKKESNK